MNVGVPGCQLHVQFGGHTYVLITPEADAVYRSRRTRERVWLSARGWLSLGQWRWLSALSLHIGPDENNTQGLWTRFCGCVLVESLPSALQTASTLSNIILAAY